MALEVQFTQHHQDQHHLLLVDGSCNIGFALARPPPVESPTITLDLFRPQLLTPLIVLEEPSPLPPGWQRFLDLKTGEVYYSKGKERMSRRSGTGPKLDLKLNLSPPRAPNPRGMAAAMEDLSPSRSGSPATNSPPSSCLSSEADHHSSSSSPEATSMVLVGCPRCLMYVMLSEDDPKCPKCKSTVLLDFLHETGTGSGKTGSRSRKRS